MPGVGSAGLVLLLGGWAGDGCLGMTILVFYLSLVVLGVDFVLLAMLPTLCILALGSRRVGPGRYRGALEAAPRLLRAITWLVRAKALYGLAVVGAVLAGKMELAWWAVAVLAGLLLGWEAALDATGAMRRFLEERASGPGPRTSTDSNAASQLRLKRGPNRAALRVLLAAVISLAAEMSIVVHYVITRLYFVMVS